MGQPRELEGQASGYDTHSCPKFKNSKKTANNCDCRAWRVFSSWKKEKPIKRPCKDCLLCQTGAIGTHKDVRA